MAKSKKKDPRTDAVKEHGEEDNTNEGLDRDDELAGEDDEFDRTLLEIYAEVEKGFEDQWSRSNEQIDAWEAFNCKLGQNQFYSGNSKIFVPAIHNAVNARTTRFSNQIFPQSGRYVECISEDGTQPDAITSLMEHYIRKTKMRTQIIPALLRNGDVEGQYNVYVSWEKQRRHIVYKTKRAVEDEEGSPLGDDKEIDDIVEETVVHGKPHIEVLADADVLVLPHTSDSVEGALANGGSVTVLRRWSKARVKKAIADGLIRKDVGDQFVKEMSKEQKTQQTDKAKEMVDAAGIKSGQRGKTFALIYETWHLMTLKTEDSKEEERRLCRTFFGGPQQILSSKRNPNWSDKCSVISVPVDKVQGQMKGISKIKPCLDIQYQANDAVNEGMDSAAYALLPIVLTDPAKSPRVGSMVLSMAAIWETSPKDTQFANMPQLWKDALTIVAACKAEISETLSVSPAAITQHSTASKTGKRSQAEVAQEQQIDILTTADAVTVVEEGILNPILQRMLELDHQHRDDELTIRQFGKMGEKARMQRIDPVQWERRYTMRWFGVEAARNAAQIQLQISGMNVLAGIPPDKYPGYRLNMVPIISLLIENMFGPRLAPLIFESMTDQMPVPAQEENKLLIFGYEVPTHPMDNDDEHIMAHTQAMQFAMANENVQAGAVKQIQAHMFKHMQQKQMKVQAAMQQQGGQPGLPGAPGGAGPGLPGRPRPGAVAGAPRGGQNPPGAIHQDIIGPQSGSPPRLRQRA